MNKEILRTIGKRGNQYNNEYDMDYNIYDDYLPKSRYHYETPYKQPRELSLLNNLLNLNNNILTNKNQLNNNFNKNKETLSLLQSDTESNKNKLNVLGGSNSIQNSNNDQIKNIPTSQSTNSHGNDNKNAKSDNNKNGIYYPSIDMDDGGNTGISDDNPSIQDQNNDQDLQLKYLYSLYRNRYENF